MPKINFPSNPVDGQIFNQNSVYYYYDANVSAWLTTIIPRPLDISNTVNTQIVFNDSGNSNGSYGLLFDKLSNTATFNNVAVTLDVAASNFRGNGAFLTGLNVGSANTWANTVGTAGNNYTNTVGTAGNNYTNSQSATQAANHAGYSNTWANTVGTAGNNYVDVKFNKNVPAFSAYRSGASDIGVPASAYANIRFENEYYDTHNAFDAANGIFTPNVAGYYMFTGAVRVTSNGSSIAQTFAAITKNALPFFAGSSVYVSTTDALSTVSGMLYLNGSTDYVQLKIFPTAAAVVKPNGLATTFAGVLLRND